MLLAAISSFAKEKHFAVFFGLGNAAMDAHSKTYLDSLVYNEVLAPGIQLAITGYTDYLGDSVRNMALSEQRANSVKDYLLTMGFKATDIETVQWKGELASADTTTNATGIPNDRRVDIIIRRPEVITKSTLADINTLKVNDLIRLNVLFQEMTHQYSKASLPVLESLYQLMLTNRTLRISIEGHICCGDKPTDEGYDLDTKKEGLSANRAKAVYDYLINKGIPANRMSYAGLKFSRPIYPQEKTQQERDFNKRVEIRILSK